jgi:hypothetical protein
VGILDRHAFFAELVGIHDRQVVFVIELVGILDRQVVFVVELVGILECIDI